MPAFLLPSQLQGAAPLGYCGSSQCLAASPVGGVESGEGYSQRQLNLRFWNLLLPVILAQGPEQAQAQVSPTRVLSSPGLVVAGQGGRGAVQLCPPRALPSLDNLALKLQAQILVECPEQSVLRVESWPGDVRAPGPECRRKADSGPEFEHSLAHRPSLRLE